MQPPIGSSCGGAASDGKPRPEAPIARGKVFKRSRSDRTTGEPFPQGIPRRTKGALSGLTSPGHRLLGKTLAPRSEVETSSVLDSGTFRASRYLPDVSGGLRADYDSASSAFSVPETTRTGIVGTAERSAGPRRYP